MSAFHPSFSICIPNFNYARYIGETIQSALNQTWDNFEIVICDNASTDKSMEVIRSFQDPRIRVFENPRNIGFAANVQRVASEARNDFMIMLSSDDLMRGDALAEYAAILREQGEERAHKTVCCSAVERIDEEGRPKQIDMIKSGQIVISPASLETGYRLLAENPANQKFSGHDVLRAMVLEWRTTCGFLATMYPRRLFQQVGGYDMTTWIWPDMLFLDRILAFNPDVFYVPKPLFQYREHRSGQNAQAMGAGALKAETDGYMRTVNFDGKVLQELGVTRDQMIKGYLNTVILAGGIVVALEAGAWLRALRIWLFAASLYPNHWLSDPRAIAIGALLTSGPAATPLEKSLRQLARRINILHHIRGFRT
ncbi:MAG: hypothetical protein GMKNLPBB_03122 [Myxococcota bacterium]|nr:hypothetical protein [Myxococcota bacterium]